MSKPPLEYRPKPARVAQRKERRTPNAEAASSTPAASAIPFKFDIDQKHELQFGSSANDINPDDAPCESANSSAWAIELEHENSAIILARIREKTRLRVQKHRERKRSK